MKQVFIAFDMQVSSVKKFGRNPKGSENGRSSGSDQSSSDKFFD